MPDVTVASRPNGEPTATTSWPTSTLPDVPMVAGVSPSTPSAWITAVSVSVSTPVTVAGAWLPSSNDTVSSAPSPAPSTTCALVRIWPSELRMIPEPDPSPSEPSTTMRTTEGSTFWATDSADPSAAGWSPVSTTCEVCALGGAEDRGLVALQSVVRSRAAEPGRAGHEDGREARRPRGRPGDAAAGEPGRRRRWWPRARRGGGARRGTAGGLGCRSWLHRAHRGCDATERLLAGRQEAGPVVGPCGVRHTRRHGSHRSHLRRRAARPLGHPRARRGGDELPGADLDLGAVGRAGAPGRRRTAGARRSAAATWSGSSTRTTPPASSSASPRPRWARPTRSSTGARRATRSTTPSTTRVPGCWSSAAS